MRIRQAALAALCLAAVSSIALAQDWRGTGRLDGWVKDDKGQPVEGATVQMTMENRAGGPKAKTNKKGYWAILGIAGGKWNMDISAPGFETKKLSVGVSEAARAPAMEIQIKPEAAQTAPGGAGVASAPSATGQQVKEAIENGNKLLGDKKYAEARAEYEKALALVPDNPAILKGIVQTYHGEKNSEKEVELLRKITELDPADTESKVLLASDLLQQGKLDEGKAMLDGLPPGSIKDPAIYVNVGILFLNKNDAAQATSYLGKAIELDPAQPDPYYYRGLSLMQQKKYPDAKADFQKYLQIAPNGPEAKEIKQDLLPALK
ncbi:MAG TPA: tetratricopeptide repeat protein [Thermoanaerobaculia bacterium]|nr:tetratricopeptide repeat protein [Thermoanaerobaculia bacterium]